MPKYLSYPNKKETASRMTRKQSRRKIFTTNKKAKKVEKELRHQTQSRREEVES